MTQSAQIHAITLVLSLINPGICIVMFNRATAADTRAEKLRAIAQFGLAVLCILSLSAIFGTRILQLFTISLDAFMVAGGGVLAWMGFAMLNPAPANTQGKSSASLMTLIMFAASPGTITGVITLAAAHRTELLPISSIVAIALATAITCASLVLASLFGKSGHSPSLAQETLSRFMGLIVLAMGVQFALTGYRQFMAG